MNAKQVQRLNDLGLKSFENRFGCCLFVFYSGESFELNKCEGMYEKALSMAYIINLGAEESPVLTLKLNVSKEKKK